MPILNPPVAGGAVDDDTAAFLRSLRTVITYDHDTALYQTENNVKTDAAVQKLVADFFGHLYVPRLESEHLLALCDHPKLLVLSGLPGVGKTTLLLYLRDRLVAQGRLVQYLNLRHEATRMGAQPSKYSVCALMYESLRKAFVANEDARRSFALYRVSNHAGYSDLKGAIEDAVSLRRLAPTAETFLALLATEPFATALARLDLGSETTPLDPKDVAPPEDENLRVLLAFLQERSSTAPILIFDNIDIYSPKLQVEVLRKCNAFLSTSAVTIVAVRSNNLRTIDDQQGGPHYRPADSYTLPAVQIDAPPKITDTLPEGTPVVTEAATVRGFLERRIRYVRAAGQLPKAAEPFVAELTKLLVEVSSVEHVSTILGALDQWANRSLRGIANHTLEVLVQLLEDRDTIYSRERVLSKGQQAIREVRNYLYKYMVCGGQLSYDSRRPEAAIHLFPRNRRQGCIAFPTFALLRYLDSQNGCRVSEVKQAFETFGLEGKLVEATILECSHGAEKPDDTARRGLLTVYAPRGRLDGADATRDPMVELLPRGRFLASTLYKTCEYLFWLAVDEVPGALRLPYPDTGNEEQRLRIAVKFVESVVVPGFRGDRAFFKHAKAKHRESYRTIFGAFGNLVVEEQIKSLHSFVDDMDGLDGVKRRELHHRLTRIALP